MKNFWLYLAVVVLLAPTRVDADVWDSATQNDNTFTSTENQLVHGSRQVHDLGAQPGPVADDDWYWITVPAYSSYEVVVDGTTGDINPVVRRYTFDGGAILQTAAAVGIGFSSRLGFANGTGVNVNYLIRVSNPSCGSTCTTSDQYTIASRETTISVARFNNAGSQITVLLTQNASDVAINVSIFYFSPAGVLLQTAGLPAFAARRLNVENTASFVTLQGQGGHILIAHDGPYGGLNVKSVALEPTTGFSFDTPGVYKGF